MKTLFHICLIIGAILCLTFGAPTYAWASCTGGSTTTSPEYGGGGGSPFTDLAGSTQTVSWIGIRSGTEIDAIEVCFREQNNNIQCKGQHGGNGGDYNRFDLLSGEYINRIEGRSAKRIDSLQFFTNTGRQSAKYGGNGGSPFTISGICLNGIGGRSGTRLDAFRAYSGVVNN